MNQEIKVVSRFLVLDDDPRCRDRIRAFCDENSLIPLKVQADNVMGVLKSKVDLGGILLAENFGADLGAGIRLAHVIHVLRPELPLFLRRDDCADLDNLAPPDQRLFASAFTVESTNLIWGAFKNRYSGAAGTARNLSQVPIVINHLHRYISFGSDNPQLCFRYTLTDKAQGDARSLVINQKFVFNLNWNPEDFSENDVSVEDLVSSGELDLF
ncbi:MAG: hypothetical protein IPN53_11280 [Comamonadaceae bacterium]|nr:hypothetical protein [Comamonadaceae bacterium]